MSAKTFRLSSIAVILFAVAINWLTGHRGLFLNDQAIVWDGGWRILQGQVPYRDFWMPLGPIPFAIQAGFFALFGVTWSATVASACFLNALVTASAIRSVRLLLPDEMKAFALLAGLSMAALFQTVFGTLWLEQTAFCFGFLAIWAVVEASAHRRPGLWIATAGVFLVLSILSKQNAGALMSLVVFGLIVVQSYPRLRQTVVGLAACLTGVTFAIACGALWLFAFSNPSRFVAAWKGAAEIGAARVSPLTLIKIVLLHPSGMMSEIAGLACIAVGAVAMLLGLSDARRIGPLAPLAAVGYLTLTSVLSQSAFQAVTLNESQNVLFLSGYALSLAAAAFTLLTRHLSLQVNGEALTFPSRRVVGAAGVSMLLLLNLGVALLGLNASWTRVVQQFKPGTTFARQASDPALSGLWFGTPGLESTNHVPLPAEDFESVARYLRAQPENFFVFGDATILYGMLHRVSPQPMLYFQQNHSYFPKDIPAVDREVTDALQKNQVSFVINETTRWQPHPDPVQSFPLLWNWIQSDFKLVAQFGVYEVWKKKEAPSAAVRSNQP